MSKNKERRSLDRVKIPDTNVVFRKEDSFNIFNRFTNISTLENISKCGICLKLDNGIQKGDVLNLQLNLPSEEKLEVKGRVRWISFMEGKMHKIGIQFEPFGKGKSLNSIAALEKLRKLQENFS